MVEAMEPFEASLQCASCEEQYIAGTVLCPECLGTDLRPLLRLEIQGPHDRSLVTPHGAQLTIGKDPDNDIVLTDDPSVSRHHALLEHIGERWSIRDVGGTNGVLVNGARIFGEHWLRNDDEVVIGRTRLRFSEQSSTSESSAGDVLHRPRLTPKELTVLKEFFRPLLSAGVDGVKKPATVREIAERLFVSDAVVKQHFTDLFDRFGIDDDGSFESR